MFTVSEAWKTQFPGAHAGVLALDNVPNPAFHPELERLKLALTEELRAKFDGLDRAAIESLPTIESYNQYYKRFKKSYHVQLQLESVVFKHKELPVAPALVTAMFMAELKNQMLTAGHDLAMVEPPLILEVSKGDEVYTLLRGQEQQLKPGDMFIADRQGVISSIIYGPDQRRQITDATNRVVYTVYAPAGIPPADVALHLQDIAANIVIFAPQAQVVLQQVFP